MEANSMVAIREVLIVAKANLDSIGASALEGELNPDAVAMICARISARIEAALSKPARNCDVGTPEEQAARFDVFVCDRRGDKKCTGKCPAHNGIDFGVVDCVIQWMQMPYEEEE